MSRPRLFSSSLSAHQRRVYGAAAVWFLTVSAAMLWPVYSWFSGIYPRVLGLPLSLAYLVCLLAVSFSVGVALYLWEDREGLIDDGGPDDGPRQNDRREPAAGDAAGPGSAG